jgi:glycosyltransferase involved in cell wall biosynthesis
MVAVMRPGKGHEDLLEAAALLTESSVRVALVGSGPEEARLLARACELGMDGTLVFAGFREDVSRVLAAADLIVHPSRADALPTALIHGLAAGIPAVATAVGGIPEIVTPETGILIPPADPPRLATAILDLAGDAAGREEMGRAARRRFRECFDGSVWAARLHALYSSLLARSPVRAHW